MTVSTNGPRLAAALILTGMALFGLIDNFVRIAAPRGGLWEFQFLRSLFSLGVLGLLVWLGRRSLRPKRPGPVIARSFVSSLALVVYFGGLSFMPIAVVVAGLFTSPVWVVIMSVVFYGERVGPRRIFAVLLGFGGAILAVGGGTGELSWFSILPVLAGGLYAWGNIATKRWCEGEGTISLLAGYNGAMLVWGAMGVIAVTLLPLPVPEGAAGFVTRGWVMPDAVFATIVIVHGLGSLIGVGLTIRAYQIADATFVSVFENTLLLFATVWAAILWAEIPDLRTIAGLVMIGLSGIIIAVRSDSPPTARSVTLPE